MHGNKKGPALSGDIRVIIRDPLGINTGIIIDNVSCYIGSSICDTRIYGIMRAVDDSETIPMEPEIYYYYLDGDGHIIHIGRGIHFGTFRINRYAPFTINLADTYSIHILTETKDIIIFASYERS